MIVPLLVLLIIDKSTGRLIDEEQIIQIDRSEPATYQTSTKFVSTTFDCSNIANGLSDFDMTSQKLTKVLGHLSPSYIRIGGTLGDRLFFSPDSVDTNKNMESTISDFTMTGTQWLQLTNLAQQANLDVIFQLNALIRLEDGSWDYSNPESLISFSNEHKLNVNWELGNGHTYIKFVPGWSFDPIASFLVHPVSLGIAASGGRGI
ncbi:hypothetical protein NQ318_015762 [Aromia moschata]|uniref:Uncharacterized protein n=1 Tax=Aromia moschata TaxID=1265417 RepID=A0AAV8XPK0_9CUCU|nr:hypothetical protein NQ318_015762 [Aromia moschata]